MPLEDWLIPWEPSVTFMAAICSTALLYWRGQDKVHFPFWRACCFWCDLLLLYLSTQTHLDYYFEQAFFAHRIQQSVVHHLSPFLIALSRPGQLLWAGTPALLRINLIKFADQTPVRSTIDALNNPFIAVGMFCGLTIFWLLPTVHLFAMLDWRWYRIMIWSMAINGLMFWNLVLNSYSFRPARLSSGCRITMLLALIPLQIVAGALLVFTGREFYPIYSLCGIAFSQLSPIEDQQIGGIILWVHGAMMSAAGILIVIYTEWMRPHRPATA